MPPPLARLVNAIASHDRDCSATELDLLAILAVSYIALPNLFFFLGWFKLPLALLLSAGMLMSIYRLGRRMRTAFPARFSPGLVLAILAVSGVWSVFSGTGHLMYANHDWVVRDAVYADLIQSHWPPAYTITPDSVSLLRSAIGFYLPTAAIASAFGKTFANLSLFLWTVAGTALFLCLLPVSRNHWKRNALIIILAVVFSGMDLPGALIATGDWPIFPLRIEWWTQFSYPSLSGQLFWAPNHTLPLWIGAALFYRHWGNRNFLELATVFVPLTLIWTPFAPIAFFPYFLLYLGRFAIERQNIPGWPVFLWAILTSILLCGFLLISAETVPTTSMGAGKEHLEFWRDYLIFAPMEFGLLALCLARHLKTSRGLLLVSALVLALLPFCSFGPSNDLMLRVSAPPLIILMMLSAKALTAGFIEKTSTKPWDLLLILSIGVATPFCEFWRAAAWDHWQPDYRNSLIDTQGGHLPGHYAGWITSSSPWHLILKEFHRIPDKTERTPDLSCR